MNRGLLLAGASEIDWIDLQAALAARGIEVVYTSSFADAVRLLDASPTDGLLVDLRFDMGVALLLHARLEHREIALCIAGRVCPGSDLYKVSFPGRDDETLPGGTASEAASRIDRLLAVNAGETQDTLVLKSV
jgi:hypothetical protein